MPEVNSDAILASFVEAKEYLGKRFGASIDVEEAVQNLQGHQGLCLASPA